MLGKAEYGVERHTRQSLGCVRPLLDYYRLSTSCGVKFLDTRYGYVHLHIAYRSICNDGSGYDLFHDGARSGISGGNILILTKAYDGGYLYDLRVG